MDDKSSDISIRDFMTRDVKRVQLHSTFKSAVKTMHELRLSCLLIDDGEDTVGIITERDLAGALYRLMDSKHSPNISEIMTSPLATISCDGNYHEALRKLHEYKCRRLVVVDAQERVCGLITRSDLIRAQKQILENEVLERTKELQHSNEMLETLTVTDPMLGIGNRRAMDTAIKRTFSLHRRYSRPYSILLMDIDCFKSFNDFYGHQIGDSALIQVATAVKSHIRNTDGIFRYGGEEFLVLLTETNLDGALIAAEHIRAVVENLQITHEKSPHQVVTSSVGVSASMAADKEYSQVIARADDALYEAKNQGKNQITTLDPAPSTKVAYLKPVPNLKRTG